MPNSPTELELYDWHDPIALARTLSAWNSAADAWRFNAESRFRKHQEAWVASRIAVGIHHVLGETTAVRMVLDREGSPDAFLRIGQRQVPADVTIVLEPDRKFREEYKGIGRSGPRGIHPIKWPSNEEVIDWISTALRNKARSAYTGLWLLVYLNTFGSQYPAMKNALVQFTTPWDQVAILASAGWSDRYSLLLLRGDACSEWTQFTLAE